MNILRISSYPTKERPGMGLHPYKITQSMSSDVRTYYVTTKNNDENETVPQGVFLNEQYFFNEKRDPSAGIFKKITFNIKRILGIISFSTRTICFYRRIDIDVVHIHSPMFILIALYYKMLGKNTYITYHGSDLNAVGKSKLYCYFLKKLTGAFAISPSMIPSLNEIHGKDSVFQTFNAIDRSEYFHDKNKQRQKRIVAVGSLKLEKGFDLLIDAFSQIEKVHPEYDLVIAGEGPLRPVLQAQITESGLDEKVTLIGHMNKSSLLDLYSTSEMFVLSSVSEGFPKVVLEALACQLKLVTTNVGAIPDFLGDYPYIVNPDASEIAEAIVKLMADSEDYGLEKVLDKYSDWRVVSDMYLEVYKSDTI